MSKQITYKSIKINKPENISMSQVKNIIDTNGEYVHIDLVLEYISNERLKNGNK